MEDCRLGRRQPEDSGRWYLKTRIVLIVVAVIVLALAILVLSDENIRKLDLSSLPRRAAWQLPDRVIEAVGVRPGDRVADLGAGSGYFIDYMAEAVGPGGRVYAVEVASGALARLAAKVRDDDLSNVEVVEGTAADAHLPDGAIDLVFLCDVYHHISDRVSYFSHLRADLTSDGRVAIVEPRDHGFGSWISPSGHATPRDELIAEMESAGYQVEASFDFLPVQNLLVFRIASTEGGAV